MPRVFGTSRWVNPKLTFFGKYISAIRANFLVRVFPENYSHAARQGRTTLIVNNL